MERSATAPRGPISWRELDSLDAASLTRRAVDPIIMRVRGRSPAIKSATYLALSTGRRALFALSVMFGHARDDGWSRFFSEMPFLSEHPGFFAELRLAVEYIADEAMLAHLGDVELAYRARERGARDRGPSFTAAVDTLAQLDRRYRALVAGSRRLAAARIREQPEEFFEVEGEHGRP